MPLTCLRGLYTVPYCSCTRKFDFLKYNIIHEKVQKLIEGFIPKINGFDQTILENEINI